MGRGGFGPGGVGAGGVGVGGVGAAAPVNSGVFKKWFY